MLCLQGHRLCLLSSFPRNRNGSPKRGQPCDYVAVQPVQGAGSTHPIPVKIHWKMIISSVARRKQRDAFVLIFHLLHTAFAPFPQPESGIWTHFPSRCDTIFCACHHLQNGKEADARIGSFHHKFYFRKWGTNCPTLCTHPVWTSRQVVGKFDATKMQSGLTWFLCWSFINKDKLSFIFSCNFAPTWHEVDGFNFRTTCPEVPDIQLPDNLSGSPRLSTSAQHGRKLQRIFEAGSTSGQLDHKFRIWLLPNLGRSYCAEPIVGSTRAQLDHKWVFIGLTSGHDGQKFFLKIVSKSDTIFNFGPSWSEIEVKNQLVTKLVTSWKGGLKKCRQVDDTFHFVPSWDEVCAYAVCNYNFVPTWDKVRIVHHF